MSLRSTVQVRRSDGSKVEKFADNDNKAEKMSVDQKYQPKMRYFTNLLNYYVDVFIVSTRHIRVYCLK